MTSAILRTPLLALVALAFATPSASADRIYRTGGTPIEDCTVVEETVSQVVYRKGRKGSEQSIPSEEVIRIEYERVPTEIGEAESLLEEDDLESAVGLYSDYLEASLEKPDKRFPWAPAYAASRLIGLFGMVGDLEGARAAADRLLENFPESRYVPSAFVAKADALYRLEKFDRAQTTLAEFEKLIVKRNLSKRWTLECRLAQILTDRSLVGEGRRGRLKALESDAGQDYPTVRTRASVARAEAFLAEASDSADALQRAREIFEDVAQDPSADEEALAAAFAGIGECVFTAAIGDEAALRQALTAFMRVAVLYRDQVRYAPKAMFYAGRCFDQIGGEENKERAKKLYSRVVRDYPGSSWAEEAKNFRK